MMHIGIAGPANPSELVQYLHPSSRPKLPGFGGTPVNLLVAAFLDLGHQVTLATLDPALPVGEVVTLHGPNLTIEIGAYRPRHRARDLFSVERRAITKALRQRQPEVVSAHWSCEFALAAIESGIPTLVTMRDVPGQIFRYQPTPYRLVRWLMHWRARSRATRVAFNSPYTQKKLGYPRGGAGVVLPNSIPDSRWRLEERCVPNPDKPKLVSVNNGFGSRKNVGRLIEAFARIRNNRPGALLILIGKGFESSGPASRWAAARGLCDGIEFTGPLDSDATLELVRAADVLVHPSLEESFGYTLIEAASVGTPVVGGRASGAVPWVLGDGKCGVLVDVSSVSSIAHAVLALLDDPQRWSRLRQNAFEGGKNRFSGSMVAKQYIEVLRGMTDAGSTRTQ